MALHPVKNGPPCSVCETWREHPGLKTEIDAERGKDAPASFDTIARYLKAHHGLTVSRFMLAKHYREGHR